MQELTATDLCPDPMTIAEEASLRYVNDLTAPGFRRIRRGRGFTYVGLEGQRVTDPATLERIKALKIPPAWSNVWICTDEAGHIQVTGLDLGFYHFQKIPFKIKGLGFAALEKKSSKINGLREIGKTRVDAKGRKQYLYHPDWIRTSQETKLINSFPLLSFYLISEDK